jgi:hypothetical protein
MYLTSTPPFASFQLYPEVNWALRRGMWFKISTKWVDKENGPSSYP